MTSKMTTETRNRILSRGFKFLYIFENKTIKEHILEVKRTDVTSYDPKNKYFWFVINGGKYIRRLPFIDSGKLGSGKEIRILGDEFKGYGNDYPWILIFDDKKLELHHSEWDPNSGEYVKIKPDDIPDEVMGIILTYFNQQHLVGNLFEKV